MPLIVEDGIGRTDANAYADVATIAAYCTLRGLTKFNTLSTTAAKEAAVVNATEWLTIAYQWHGWRITREQALAWPRYDNRRRLPAGVPQQVVQATARVAEAIAAGSDMFKVVSGKDLVRRVQAGSVSVEFSDLALDANASGGVSMPFLDNLLAGLFESGPDGARQDGVGSFSVSRR
jgi:hypothetical protein